MCIKCQTHSSTILSSFKMHSSSVQMLLKVFDKGYTNLKKKLLFISFEENVIYKV